MSTFMCIYISFASIRYPHLFILRSTPKQQQNDNHNHNNKQQHRHQLEKGHEQTTNQAVFNVQVRHHSWLGDVGSS